MFRLFNREPDGYVDLSPEEVHERLRNGGKVQLIDVRSPGEFKRGHIAKARLIPLGELQKRTGEIKKGHDIILYCQTASRSRRAAKTLSKMGYENVYNMTGGMARWPYGVK
jgi:rhodanese-related sulfurtransferase